MEPAIRLIHLVWIDALLDAPPDGRSIVAKLAFEHAFWIWRYRSFGSSANNHLLGELAALVCATARWPELQNICALPLVTDALEREILLQFAPDGGNREQALHYHLFALEYGVLAAHSLHALGQPLRSEVRDRLGAAADFFATVAAPAEGWDYGDSDDAHVVPLFTRDISHAGEWRGWCRRERSATALSYWLPLRDQVIGAPRSGDLSENWTCLPDSGFAVWQKGEWFLRFDASPLGYLATRAHGHLDALHLSAWLGEDAFLIDSGTGSYFVDPTLRTTLAGADRHNGPFLRNGGYPQRQGTFLWSQPHSDPFLETAAQGVRGEIQLKPGKISRVIRETSGGFTVEDRASGDAQVRWTLAPDWKIEATGRDHFTAKLGERQVSLTFTGAARPPVLEKVTVSPSFRRTEKTLSIVLPMNASGVLMSAFTVLSRP